MFLQYLDNRVRLRAGGWGGLGVGQDTVSLCTLNSLLSSVRTAGSPVLLWPLVHMAAVTERKEMPTFE